MKSRSQNTIASLGSRPPFRDDDPEGAGQWLRRLVDMGLVGVICIAPYFFGGRHDLGRLVYVTLVAVTATAWFVRQALQPTSPWKNTAAYGVLLLAVGLLLLQIVPLPAAWIDWLAPRNAQLLPLWHSSGGGDGLLGSWNTISLVPHETAKALALLLAHCLLFVVVVERIDGAADVQRMLRWIGVSAVIMACFGLVQYSTTNGRFFWFYEYPFRNTGSYPCGSFINRNHFANFLVLGIGPLVSWLLDSMRQNSQEKAKRRNPSHRSTTLLPLVLGAAIVIVLFAILLSLSRGGTLALMTAVVVIGLVYARCRLIDSKYLWASTGMAVVVLGLLSLYGYDLVSQRLTTLTQGSMEAVDRDHGRRKIWSANVAAFQAGGLAGAGAASHQMIYPVHLSESLQGEYTHAESGYLQFATETGVLGVVLLATGLGLCGAWCLTCVRHRRSDIEQLCFGAACGGLAASAVHSVVDFVWYIPACMSVTVVLAACTLRLAQMARSEAQSAAGEQRPFDFRLVGAYRLTAAAVAVAGIWMVWTYVGPAGASIHWDRYLRVSAANGTLSKESLARLVANAESKPTAEQDREAMLQAMLRHLERVIAWDPNFARARLRLAAHLLSEFERRQQAAANAMDVSQIADAALASQFKSPSELKSWLGRAFGENGELLYRALDHAHAGVAQCPLQGEGYLALANLCFLEGATRVEVGAYVDQGLRVRPHDGELLFEVGRRALVDGDVGTAMRHWTKCFRDTGPHQLKIIYLLAGRIPARLFLENFQPEWHTLPHVWARYSEKGQPQDLADLVAYAAMVTRRQVRQTSDIPPDSVWLWQASMYGDVHRPTDALACLQEAYRCNPRSFEVRYALGRTLLDVGRYAEAEPHFRWCSSRRPENRDLSVALDQISKQRHAQRHPDDAASPDVVRAWER